MNYKICILLSSLLAVLVVAHSTPASAYQRTYGPTRQMPDAVTPWEGAGVYVFGHYVLDMTKLAERDEPFTIVGVNDCSTQAFFCVSAKQLDPISGLVHFAAPRKCTRPAIGDRWTAGKVTTEVLNILHRPIDPRNFHSSEPETSYFLGSPEYPDVVYEYAPHRGILAIFVGYKENLVAQAKKSPRISDKVNPNWRLYLTTFDPLAACSDTQ